MGLRAPALRTTPLRRKKGGKLMIKRFLISLALLLAVAAVPTAAQAWQWYSNGVVIPALATSTPVATKGTLTFNVKNSSGMGLGVIVCKVKDTEGIVNKTPFGFDEVETMTLKCKAKLAGCPVIKPMVTALGLVWYSELITSSSPARDEIQNVDLEVKCGSAVLGTMTGNLTPKVTEFPLNTSRLEFGPGSGVLAGPCAGCKTEITGTDKLKGPPGDTKISAGP
jgi:hypothetical protein